MALSVSRRLLRRFGSLSAPFRASHDSHGVASGNVLFPPKGESSLVACRSLSSTILIPNSSDGTSRADLLLKKAVQTPEQSRAAAGRSHTVVVTDDGHSFIP